MVCFSKWIPPLTWSLHRKMLYSSGLSLDWERSGAWELGGRSCVKIILRDSLPSKATPSSSNCMQEQRVRVRGLVCMFVVGTTNSKDMMEIEIHYPPRASPGLH